MEMIAKTGAPKRGKTKKITAAANKSIKAEGINNSIAIALMRF
jgi:hypothetical protein